MSFLARAEKVEILGAGRGGRNLLESHGRTARRRAAYPDAAVALSAVKGSLGVLFRGLGGEARRGDQGGRRRGFTTSPLLAPPLCARNRASRKRRASTASTLFLPRALDVFPAGRSQPQTLPVAVGAGGGGRPRRGTCSADPLQRDIVRLRCAHRDSEKAVAAFPGMRAMRDDSMRPPFPRVSS